jgi:hypothetical protein
MLSPLSIERKKQETTSATECFTWTDSKSDLVEILQSILQLESINKGNVKKGDFILYMGSVLNIDLSNHNSLFNDILSRYDDPNESDSRLRYLRRLVKALSGKLIQLDRKK